MNAWGSLVRETASALTGFDPSTLESLAQRAESMAANQQAEITQAEVEQLLAEKDILFALLESTKGSIHILHHLRVERQTREFSDRAS
jgi:hypothetical protein